MACEEITCEIADLERARRFYVRARQTRTGLAQTASPGRWAHCVQTSRAGMAGAVSRWFGGIEDLFYIADRLMRVQIENAPAIEVIQRYDSEETFFYCDPPYPHGSRGDPKAYAWEMTDRDHEKLAGILHSVKGKVALSSYHCDLMDKLYSDWKRVEAPEKLCHSVKSLRREVLWINYELEDTDAWKRPTKSSKEPIGEQQPLLSNLIECSERRPALYTGMMTEGYSDGIISFSFNPYQG